jgi:hypothetical protein
MQVALLLIGMPRSKTIDALGRAELTNYNNVERWHKMARHFLVMQIVANRIEHDSFQRCLSTIHFSPALPSSTANLKSRSAVLSRLCVKQLFIALYLKLRVRRS